MRRLQGHSENGPVRRAAAHAQQRAGSSRLARRKWRTFADVDGAPRLARLLEVLVELVRPGSCTAARTQLAPAAWTKNMRTSKNQRVGQGMSRERGALGLAVRARRSPHLQRRAATLLQHAPAAETFTLAAATAGRQQHFSGAKAALQRLQHPLLEQLPSLL